MKKTLEKFSPFLIFFGYFFILFFSVTLIILESNTQLGEVRLTTDFVSWALSGMAPFFEIGYPYVNYWGINPPGLLLLTTTWGVLVGPSLQSFHILYLLSLSVIVFFVWKIIKKLFTFYESLLLFFIFILIFFSNTVQSQFFPSEINGLLFTLLGLNLILKHKISKKDIFWASFVFILSGQMKEVFAFSGFALLPHLLVRINQSKKQVRDFFFFSTLGIISCLLLLAGYLYINEALLEYRNVINDKSDRFSITDTSRFESNLSRSVNFPKDRFIQFTYQPTVLLFITFISLLMYLSLEIKVREIKKAPVIYLQLPNWLLEYSIILFFWIGSTIGYMMQGRYGNKYEIQALLPTILIITISVKIISKSLFKLLKIKLSSTLLTSVTFFLLIVFLTPKKFFFLELLANIKNYSVMMHVEKWNNLENKDSLKLEEHIKKNTSKDDCITAVYGWGVGSHYYYSNRRSCSKHFLVNIIAPNNWKEYQNELIANPPKAILYIVGGADIDIKQFESNVFDFSSVIKKCYKQDTEFTQLFWLQNGIDTHTCLQSGIPQQK